MMGTRKETRRDGGKEKGEKERRRGKERRGNSLRLIATPYQLTLMPKLCPSMTNAFLTPCPCPRLFKVP